MSRNNSYAPRRVRFIAGLSALCFAGTFVLALPSRVLSDEAAVSRTKLSRPPVSPIHYPIPPPKSLRENLRPLSPQEAHKLQAAAKHRLVTDNVSLLDNIGHLKGSLAQGQIAQWQNRLRPSANPKLSAIQSARLQLSLGEARLAKDEEPLDAIAHFTSAIQFARAVQVAKSRAVRRHAQSARGKAIAEAVIMTARRDIGFGLFYSGQYAQSAATLHTLLTSHKSLLGVDRRETALFLRHASACAGYHAERSKMGITEPLRLDPLCGVEALAACLRGLHLPYDKKAVRPLCRVTGEGSSLADVIQAATKLKLTSIAFQADPIGLQTLNSPLVAFVEHDHFVALTHADVHGVTYLCSDCGLWPGGERKVTWKQWKAMEAGPYLAVCLPSSSAAQALQISLRQISKTPAIAQVPQNPN